MSNAKSKERYRMSAVGFWERNGRQSVEYDARGVFHTLLTHPHLGTAGAMRESRAGLAAEMGIPSSDFVRIVNQLTACGLIAYRDGWVAIVGWISTQAGNDKFAKGAAADLTARWAPSWVVDAVMGRTLPDTLPDTVAVTLPDTLPDTKEQEHEQEHDQESDSDGDNHARRFVEDNATCKEQRTAICAPGLVDSSAQASNDERLQAEFGPIAEGIAEGWNRAWERHEQLTGVHVQRCRTISGVTLSELEWRIREKPERRELSHWEAVFERMTRVAFYAGPEPKASDRREVWRPRLPWLIKNSQGDKSRPGGPLDRLEEEDVAQDFDPAEYAAWRREMAEYNLEG